MQRRFEDLTAERDRPIESETEARGYPTEDGYVHEVISRSPNRQTVTKRVTVTQSDLTGSDRVTPTAPKFIYCNGTTTPHRPSSTTTSEVGGMSSATGSHTDRMRPLPTNPRVVSPSVSSPTSQNGVVVGYSSRTQSVASALHAQPALVQETLWQRTHNNSGGKPTDDPRNAAGLVKPREVEQLGPLSWVTTTPRQPQDQRYASPSSTSAPYYSGNKAVRIGGTETTLVEPSRVSPLLVRQAYAPVRYIPKRELRARQRGQQEEIETPPHTLHVRQSSVPRLDAWMHDPPVQQEQHMTPQQQQQHMMFHGGREFYPAGGDSNIPNEYPPVSSGRGGSSSQRRSTPGPYAYGGAPVGAEQDDEDRWESVSQRSSVYASQPMSRRGSPPRSPYAVRGQMEFPAMSPTLTTLDQLPNVVHVMDMAEKIAFSRRLPSVPQPPPQCQDAFRLLYRGVYMVKYGRQGPPHERYLAMRLVESERHHQPQPFLVWATHSDSASFKDRIHLALLVEVIPGVNHVNNNFRRHMITSQTIAGPSLGGKKSTLPVTFAFTLVFVGADRRRTVDCLCLDDQTYHCWLMVCQYFASINNMAQGGLVQDVETMAPDTPRSMSAR